MGEIADVSGVWALVDLEIFARLSCSIVKGMVCIQGQRTNALCLFFCVNDFLDMVGRRKVSGFLEDTRRCNDQAKIQRGDLSGKAPIIMEKRIRLSWARSLRPSETKKKNYQRTTVGSYTYARAGRRSRHKVYGRVKQKPGPTRMLDTRFWGKLSNWIKICIPGKLERR